MNPPETHDTPADNPADNPAAAPVPEGEAETATDDEYSTASTGQPKRSDRASNAIWLFKWFVVVAALGVLLDNAFGDRDRLAAANKEPIEFVARVENFDRPDAPTLDYDNAPLFLVTSGSFQIDQGRAKSSSDTESVAVASLPGNVVGAVSMAVFDAQSGSGVVVRYQDPANYWLVTPHPSHGTWSLVKVENGTSTTMTETANAFGTENVNVAVQTTGDNMVIRFNGRMETVLAHPFLAEVPATGFLAAAGDANTSFDDFAIYYPPAP